MPEPAGEAFHAAVFFMDDGQVGRQMRYSEFEAFLDGYVGLSDMRETDVKAVYVHLSPALGVQSLVFFRIYFDEEGRADSSWNIPVETLARTGGRGPDLGNGPIRLVCRSQCPDPGLAEELWDPDMSPSSNDFQSIRKAVKANRLRFPKQEEEVEIPVLTTAATTASETTESRADEEHRAKLARLIREQRLRIKMLQSTHRDRLLEHQRQHRMEVQALRLQMEDLSQQYQQIKIANEQLKRKLGERNEQYLALQEKLPAAEAVQQSESSRAESVLLKEQLERKQRELDMRGQQLQAAEEELEALRAHDLDDKGLLEQLREHSIFLVAYHPGVGHITIPYDELSRYLADVQAYAAGVCGITPPAYARWLAHYEEPVCTYREKNEPCGAPVLRIGVPAEFRPGRDDRCEEHQDAEASSPAGH